MADPQLAQLLKAVYGISIPPAPRNDLVAIFATGIPVNAVTGPNYTTFLSDGKPHEMMRLNVAIAPSSSPSRLGLLGGDVAGFPNGRRVFDDVTDIELRAVAGGTPFTPATNVAPNNTLGDGVSNNDVPYLTRFPTSEYRIPETARAVHRISTILTTSHRCHNRSPDNLSEECARRGSALFVVTSY